MHLSVLVNLLVNLCESGERCEPRDPLPCPKPFGSFRPLPILHDALTFWLSCLAVLGSRFEQVSFLLITLRLQWSPRHTHTLLLRCSSSLQRHFLPRLSWPTRARNACCSSQQTRGAWALVSCHQFAVTGWLSNGRTVGALPSAQPPANSIVCSSFVTSLYHPRLAILLAC